MKQEDSIQSITTTNNSGEQNSNLVNSITKAPVQGKPTADAVNQFIAFQTSIGQIRETMAANLGEGAMKVTDLERIRIPSGGGVAWTVPDISEEQIVKELSGVILMWREVRMYWQLPMDQSDGAMPPDCYAPDARTGVGSPGGDCGRCRFAQFGSAATGEGQACKLVRQLFFLRPENLLPDIVSLPAGSLKAVRLYFKRLAKRGLPCHSLITKIGLEKARNSQGREYSRATFAAGEPLPPELSRNAGEYAAMMKSFIDAAPPAPLARTQEEGDVV